MKNSTEHARKKDIKKIKTSAEFRIFRTKKKKTTFLNRMKPRTLTNGERRNFSFKPT